MIFFQAVFLGETLQATNLCKVRVFHLIFLHSYVNKNIKPVTFTCSTPHRVHTKWQRPLSGVHSIVMEKLAGEGGGALHAHPHPLTLYLPSYKVAVYAPAERADTLTLVHLYFCILCGTPYIIFMICLIFQFPVRVE